MTALEKYNARVDAVNSLVCVGLDPELEKLSPEFSNSDMPQFEFNKRIIDLTHEHAAAYKANIAFYESRGDQGLRELKATVDYLRANHPDIPVFCDAKRNEVINTMKEYAKELFDWFGFDGATVNPYLGSEPLEPFLERKDKAVIVLCRTSNPGAGEIQDLRVTNPYESGTNHGESRPLWQVVAEKVRDGWNKNGNCMLVVGATRPEELRQIRQVAGEMTFLVPGVGSQGGSVEATVKAGLNSAKKGLIIVSARGIIFADDPAKAAQDLKEEINIVPDIFPAFN